MFSDIDLEILFQKSEHMLVFRETFMGECCGENDCIHYGEGSRTVITVMKRASWDGSVVDLG